MGRAESAGRGDRLLAHPAGEEAVQVELAAGCDRRGGQLRLLLGVERSRALVVALDLGELGRRCERRQLGILGRAREHLRRAAGERREAVVVGAVRARPSRTTVADEAELNRRVLDQGRLVHLRLREPSEAGTLRSHEHLGVLGDVLERTLGDRQRLAHDFTPTWTFRNRAGDAPCET